MSKPSSSFKVIIAGGGVGGLTLANALDKAGIDYVLLEKRDIAPDLGASIANLPFHSAVHGQLGMEQAIVDRCDPLLIREHYKEQGRMFCRSEEFKILLENTGRGIVFMERSFLLASLHANIADKSKIRARTGVRSFSEDLDGVSVMTEQGETIRGSILVGTDGVHSSVRAAMAKAVEQQDPRAARLLDQSFTVRYRCLFGISPNHFKDDPHRIFIPDSTAHNAYYRDISILACTGSPGFVFWFIYSPIEAGVPGQNPVTAQYSQADCEALIARTGHLHVSSRFTVNDLWQSRLKGTMIPMQEGVVQTRWNSGGRVVLLGDAAHKATVNVGLGGNSVCEGVCYLANELVALVRTAETAGRQPTTDEITAAFERYEAKQRPRAQRFVTISHYACRFEVMESWWLRLILVLVFPFIPLFVRSRLYKDIDQSAPRLDFLPVAEPRKPVRNTSA